MGQHTPGGRLKRDTMVGSIGDGDPGRYHPLRPSFCSERFLRSASYISPLILVNFMLAWALRAMYNKSHATDGHGAT